VEEMGRKLGRRREGNKSTEGIKKRKKGGEEKGHEKYLLLIRLHTLVAACADGERKRGRWFCEILWCLYPRVS
jgi:hypothetical protein